ncbi:MAG TPA: cupin domain-containing protein [Solirubrobacteraceae bacterium]|jgi:quercetin dioxygenase-like cupin family protein|nr:cupin domain-containing protein [Solirubrobacteraceae bacterium]
MSTSTSIGWSTGWTVEQPAKIGFVDVPAGEGNWETGLRAHFEYRDLGLANASDGMFSAKHIRVVEGAAGELNTGWHCHDVDMQFFYVLKGWVKIRTEDGEVTLRAGDSGYQPPLYFHEETVCSPDYELFEITCPAEVKTIHGRESELPARAADLDPSRKPVYTRDVDENYVVGNGPRDFFAYRDLGTRDPTGGRVHLHTVAMAGGRGNDEGTGWHYHSMAQWFYILEGKADLRVENGTRRHLVPGDAVCIGSGPNMRHFVGPISGDYKLVEMCVPANYDTITVDAPEGAAR